MKLTEENIKAIISLVREGKRPFDILPTIPGLRPSQLSDVLRKLGVAPFRRGRRTITDWEAFRKQNNIEPYFGAATMKAKDLGVSRQRLNQILNPKKAKSRNIFAKCLRQGIILKPTRCNLCGTEAHLEGHHPDYSKPIAVLWLCKKCHVKQTIGRK